VILQAFIAISLVFFFFLKKKNNIVDVANVFFFRWLYKKGMFGPKLSLQSYIFIKG
jgi:hypothetical protein